jgi:transposase
MDAVSIQQLLAENQQLRQEIQQLRELRVERDRRIEQLEQTVRDLQQRLEETERKSKRQAAPFSKGEPKKHPKKPGRKSGDAHGQHGHRQPPAPEQVDETLEAPLPEQCPDCGGNVVEDHLDQQFQTEIPRKPIVRQFNIHCGHCAQCGKRLRGRHDLQTSDATGAAQSQIGPDAQATIVDLNKRAGMSYGKIADTFDTVFGIPLTRGACAQTVLRAADKLEPVYAEIKEHIQVAEHLTPDETGWRIGGHPVWLHTSVAGDGATLYVIDARRSAEVLEEIIGIHWGGSMTHDGFSSYERFEDALHQQCVDHALRRARGLLERHTGAAQCFPGQVIDLFRGALRLRDHLIETHADTAAREDAFVASVDRLRDLTTPRRVNEANARLSKHLSKHLPNWFVFLLDPTIPATNHRAEQALKTPIVNRKVWGGNRTEAGGKAQVITCSVLQTCKKLAINAFTFISHALRGTVGQLFGR